MGPTAPARSVPNVRGLPPNIFAMVMATGIVSLALNGAGQPILAHILFWLNVGLYAVLLVQLPPVVPDEVLEGKPQSGPQVE